MEHKIFINALAEIENETYYLEEQSIDGSIIKGIKKEDARM